MDVLRERMGRARKNTIHFERIATSAEAFTYDFFGNDRGGKFTAGPIADMPLDGSEFSIDPRILK